eukprot:GHRR01013946.1.p1 GENE.GHRR01013946.1~~GHRR01013946.1.p1  ORF type:complete len:902 (+),score=300.53 GHRR01013946.1:340-3045(+)
MHVEAVKSGQVLGKEGSTPQQLVIIRQGTVRVTGRNLPVPVDAGPGASFFLIELLLNQAASATIITSTDALVWVVSAPALLELAGRRPDLVLELGLRLSQDMAGKLEQMEASMQDEERRQRALQPYLVSTPKRGIVGNSKYADRLRRQIVAAARDHKRSHCLIFGEPGLRKDNIAALLHFGSPDRHKPMVEADAAGMDPFMTELFGRGSKEGLLHWIRDGTLAIYNVHKAAPHMIPQLQQLLQAGTYQPAPAPAPLGSIDYPPAERQATCRIIMTAQQRVPALDGLATVIQVPPLRVRPADILDLARYFVRLLSKQRGVRLQLTPEAERTLASYTFPNNVNELESVVERAAVQAINTEEGDNKQPQQGNKGAGLVQVAAATNSQASGSSLMLDKDVFWFAAQSRDSIFKWNTLNSLPLLRQLLRSDMFPELINHKIVKPVFAIVVLLLFIGPQDRAHNFCLNLFWDYWWPLIFIIYPFLGRIWCSICPFMIYGEVMQRWRMATGAVLNKWPRQELEQWGGWFLFGLFAAILVWEEVWDLPDKAALSSWLLLLITGGAVVCSAIFERRLWCRYLCPIGGMNGLFAKLSMTELRARQGVCSGTCSTYHCYRGGPPEPPEGQETLGCPVYSHPAQLTDNRNCVLCMTCLKACPHRSIEFRLRLPGVDLWTSHKPAWSEVALQFMLLGAVYLHRLSELEEQFGVDPQLRAGCNAHILVSVVVLALPGLAAWGTHGLTWLWAAASSSTTPTPGAAVAVVTAGSSVVGGASSSSTSRRNPSAVQQGIIQSISAAGPAPVEPFLRLSYSYLPLVWGATLSHYLHSLLEEAGTIAPATAATFGLQSEGLPVLVANHAVTEFLQGSVLLAGAGLSLLLTRKIGARPWRLLLPQCLAIMGFTAELWYLIVR